MQTVIHMLLPTQAPPRIYAPVLMLIWTGNIQERMAMCTGANLTTSYLDLRFQGTRQFILAGGVNFSYFRFGPLEEPTGISGKAVSNILSDVTRI